MEISANDTEKDWADIVKTVYCYVSQGMPDDQLLAFYLDLKIYNQYQVIRIKMWDEQIKL